MRFLAPKRYVKLTSKKNQFFNFTWLNIFLLEPKVCKEDEFNCSDSSMCIDKKWKCDGDFDCADHSDERDCKGTIFDGEGHLCSDTDFTCASGDECIHKTWACDGDQDCLDGSDEGDHCKLA